MVATLVLFALLLHAAADEVSEAKTLRAVMAEYKVEIPEALRAALEIDLEAEVVEHRLGTGARGGCIDLVHILNADWRLSFIASSGRLISVSSRSPAFATVPAASFEDACAQSRMLLQCAAPELQFDDFVSSRDNHGGVILYAATRIGEHLAPTRYGTIADLPRQCVWSVFLPCVPVAPMPKAVIRPERAQEVALTLLREFGWNRLSVRHCELNQQLANGFWFEEAEELEVSQKDLPLSSPDCQSHLTWWIRVDCRDSLLVKVVNGVVDMIHGGSADLNRIDRRYDVYVDAGTGKVLGGS